MYNSVCIKWILKHKIILLHVYVLAPEIYNQPLKITSAGTQDWHRSLSWTCVIVYAWDENETRACKNSLKCSIKKMIN